MKLTVIGDPACIHFSKRLQALQKKGWEIFLIATSEAVPVDPSPSRVFFFETTGRRWFKKLKLWMRFLRLMRQTPTQMIYIFGGDRPLCWVVQLFAKAPVFLALIGSDLLEMSLRPFFHQKVSLQFLRYAARVSALTAFMEKNSRSPRHCKTEDLSRFSWDQPPLVSRKRTNGHQSAVGLKQRKSDSLKLSHDGPVLSSRAID